MIRAATIVLAIMLNLAAGAISRAQDAAVPEPFLRATLVPERVTVGQMVVLTLDVLVPNFFATTPVVPDFQIRNAITRTLDRTNFAEQKNGATLAGIRYRFGIYPQQAGHYEVASGTIQVSYAEVPPNHRDVTLTIPRLSADATFPDAAKALKPFVGASGLTMTQSVRQSSSELKVGDSITRTIVVTAQDTPAMLLPPISFAAIDGLAVYPDQPVLADQADSRSDALTGARTDQATYMLQKAGDFVLPAIDVAWWRFEGDAIQHARVDPLPLRVADNPALRPAPPVEMTRSWNWRGWLDWLFEHWRTALLAAAVAAALAWIARPISEWVLLWYRRWRRAYQASEARAFRMLRRAIRKDEATGIYEALLDWISHVDGLAPPHSIRGLRAVVHDPGLDREIALIERSLFANDTSGEWSPRTLMRRLAAARRHLRLRPAESMRGGDLPVTLNPQSGDRELWRRRAVAR